MSRTKLIYFLSAFVLIIGCFALNQSYSMFTDTKESEPITAIVPKLDVSMSLSSVNVEAGKEYLIKQTVTNNSIIPVNFGIKTDYPNNVSIATHESIENNLSYGIKGESDTSLGANTSKDIYFIVSNIDGAEDITINFELEFNYTTITTTVEALSNINTECKNDSGCEVLLPVLPYNDKPDTLTYKILTNNLKSSLNSLFSEGGNNVVWPLEDGASIPSLENFKDVEKEEVGIFKTEDDYGETYYFRGASSVNYVSFAGFTWRIVRVNGDGSVRLVLDGTLDKVAKDGVEVYKNTKLNLLDTDGLVPFNELTNDNAYIGYMYGFTNGLVGKCITKDAETGKFTIDSSSTYLTKETCESASGRWAETQYDTTNININDSFIKKYVDTFYEEFLIEYEDYFADTMFCCDKSLTKIPEYPALGYGPNESYNAGFERLDLDYDNIFPTLKCAPDDENNYSRYTVNGQDTITGVKTNGDLKYPIALLTADELVMAGADANNQNLEYYLYNENLNKDWWALTPAGYNDSSINYIATITGISSYFNEYDDYNSGVRPVINLDLNKVLWDEGDGTSGSPYKVKLAE